MRRCVGVCILILLAAVAVWRYRPARISLSPTPDPILDRPLPAFKFDGTVEDALMCLGRQTGLTLSVARAQFAEDWGNRLDGAVHLDLRDVTPRQALVAIEWQGGFGYQWDGLFAESLLQPDLAARMYRLNGALGEIFPDRPINEDSSAFVEEECLGLPAVAIVVGGCRFALHSADGDHHARHRLAILRDWLAATHSPGTAPALRLDTAPGSAEVLRRLRQPAAEFDCENTPLREAFVSLGRQLGVNILLVDRWLEAVGIEMHRIVTIRIRNSTGEQALDQMLRCIGENQIELGWCEWQGFALVPGGFPQVWVYDVRDLAERLRMKDTHAVLEINSMNLRGTPDELIGTWANGILWNGRTSYAGHPAKAACISGRLFARDEPYYLRRLDEALRTSRAAMAEGKP